MMMSNDVYAELLAEEYEIDPKVFCKHLHSKGVPFFAEGKSDLNRIITDEQFKEILSTRGKTVVKTGKGLLFSDYGHKITISDLFVDESKANLTHEEIEHLKNPAPSETKRGKQWKDIRTDIDNALKEFIPQFKYYPRGNPESIWKKRDGRIVPNAAAMARIIDFHRHKWPKLKKEARGTQIQRIEDRARKLINKDAQFRTTLGLIDD